MLSVDLLALSTAFLPCHTEAAKASKPPPPSPAFGDEDDYLSASFVAEKPNAPRGKRSLRTDPEQGRGKWNAKAMGAWGVTS